jgi:hypothetical protein
MSEQKNASGQIILATGEKTAEFCAINEEYAQKYGW